VRHSARPLTDKERQEFRKDRPKPGYRWFAKEHRKYQNWLRKLPQKSMQAVDKGF
jgi:hypothetical protein